MRTQRMNAVLWALALLSGAAVAGGAPAEPAAAQVPAGSVEILNSESYWRWFLTLRKPIIPVEALKAAGQEAAGSTPPPA